MHRHHNTGSCPNATGVFYDLPLFRWANTRVPVAHILVPSLAVTVLARRFCLSEHLARAIAENAGFPVEAAHA
jgi:hypothetical protein